MATMIENNQLFCTFRSADHWFGVPVGDVKEVTTQTTCTRIPHAPRGVAGYVNIRGHIFMALDPRVLLGLEAGATAENRLILFKPGVGPSLFGLLVDEIGDIVAVSADQIENYGTGAHKPPAGVPVDRADLITRVCKLPEGLLAILEPRYFVPMVEQSIIASI
jgi:purine-binding chemotaxis protein CheW